MNDLKEALIAARKNVDSPEKWIKGALKGKNNTYCTVGAIHKLDIPCSLHFDISRTMRRITETESLSSWNDAPERTHQDILDLFDKAIILAGVSGPLYGDEVHD